MKNEIDIDALEALREQEPISWRRKVVSKHNAFTHVYRSADPTKCDPFNNWEPLYAQPKPADRELLADAARHLTNWLEMHDCECEAPGHPCGREEVTSTRDKLLNAENGATMAREIKHQSIMNRIAQRKLDELISEGWQIDGYAITKNGKHGMVTSGGRVLWWGTEPIHAPSGWAITIEPTQLAHKYAYVHENFDGENGLCGTANTVREALDAIIEIEVKAIELCSKEWGAQEARITYRNDPDCGTIDFFIDGELATTWAYDDDPHTSLEEFRKIAMMGFMMANNDHHL